MQVCHVSDDPGTTTALLTGTEGGGGGGPAAAAAAALAACAQHLRDALLCYPALEAAAIDIVKQLTAGTSGMPSQLVELAQQPGSSATLALRHGALSQPMRRIVSNMDPSLLCRVMPFSQGLGSFHLFLWVLPSVPTSS